jgi:uncharacterized membrane protein HdeD (DUF308 family)
MEPIFFLLTVVGIVLEIIGAFGIIKELVKDERQPNAFKILICGVACHGIAFLILYM